ncbi:MAG: hypothetical protein AAFV19_02310 [Pseudomonadota bacterium]
MVRYLTLAAVVALVACDTARYQKPISFPTHGTAVRTNMAAHIIDPRPPGSRPVPVDSDRAITSIERYRADDVKVPNAVETSPSVSTATPADE